MVEIEVVNPRFTGRTDKVMGIFGNVARLVRNPVLAREYASYALSTYLGEGEATRRLFGNIEVGGFSGFSEYHSCASYVSKEEYTFLTQVPLDGKVIVDVGANLGIVSILLAGQYPGYDVHAFEPNPYTFRALEKNLSRNGADNVIPNAKAVGDADEQKEFQAFPRNRATARFSNSSSEHATEVPCVRLDTYMSQAGIVQIELLKVDVEGFEMSVFQGGQSAFEEHHVSVVYFEVCPEMARKAGYEPKEAPAFLEECGYSLYRINSEGELDRVTPSDTRTVTLENWVALSPHRK